MLLQEFQKLLLERHPAMVLLLLRDVVRHVSRLRAAHSEGGVSGPPGKPFLRRKLFVHPARRIGFHHSQQLRDRFSGGKGHQQANVICRAVDNQGNTVGYDLAPFGLSDGAQDMQWSAAHQNLGQITNMQKCEIRRR